MKNVKLTIIGICAVSTALVLNIQHALNDYGILDNKLHVEVLAQSNDSGDGTGSSTGWFWKLKKTGTKCTYTSGGASGSVSGGTGTGSVSIGGSTTGGFTYEGYTWECYDGWNPFCSKDCRAPL